LNAVNTYINDGTHVTQVAEELQREKFESPYQTAESIRPLMAALVNRIGEIAISISTEKSSVGCDQNSIAEYRNIKLDNSCGSGTVNADTKNYQLRSKGSFPLLAQSNIQILTTGAVTIAKRTCLNKEILPSDANDCTNEPTNRFADRMIWTILHEATHAILRTGDQRRCPVHLFSSIGNNDADLQQWTLQFGDKYYKNADSWTVLIFRLYRRSRGDIQ